MMNNGLTFGAEGPIMDGTWYNTTTGDSFTVQNSFFEDNQFIIQTTDGRVLGYDQIQDYIKSDNPINVKKPEPQTILPPEVAEIIDNDTPDAGYGILEDDLMMINGNNSLGNLGDNLRNNITETTQPVNHISSNMNYDIISKALTKRSLPNFNIEVDWGECPIKEMNMLMDLMDVSESEIIDWYTSQCNVELTTIMIKEIISDYIYKQLHPDVIINTTQEPEIEKKPKKLKTKKK